MFEAVSIQSVPSQCAYQLEKHEPRMAWRKACEGDVLECACVVLPMHSTTTATPDSVFRQFDLVTSQEVASQGQDAKSRLVYVITASLPGVGGYDNDIRLIPSCVGFRYQSPIYELSRLLILHSFGDSIRQKAHHSLRRSARPLVIVMSAREGAIKTKLSPKK